MFIDYMIGYFVVCSIVVNNISNIIVVSNIIVILCLIWVYINEIFWY